MSLSKAAGTELADSKERSKKEGEGAEEQTRSTGKLALAFVFRSSLVLV